MSITGARVTALIVLFVITFIVGTVPVFLFYLWQSRRAKSATNSELTQSKPGIGLSDNVYVQILSQIGGGVLFYTVLAHMIPEILENYETYLNSDDSLFKNKELNKTVETENKSNDRPSLPLVELAVCGGFFMIYLLEELVHTLLIRDDHNYGQNLSVGADIKSKKQDLNVNGGRINFCFEDSTESSQSGANCRRRDILMNDMNHQNKESPETYSYCSEIEIIKQSTAADKSLAMRLLDGFIIVIAFTVHSLFDGISIGVQPTVTAIWEMFVAITTHKLLVAFILSVELYEKCANYLLVVFYMTVFSLMSPIGILIVIVMKSSITQDGDGQSNPIIILLSAISAGTILYIVFFEILQKERVKNLHGIVQFVAMAFGFGLMLAVVVLFPEI